MPRANKTVLPPLLVSTCIHSFSLCVGAVVGATATAGCSAARDTSSNGGNEATADSALTR